MARPKKTAHNKLDCSVCVRLSREEYDRWKAKVAESGLSTSEFFRQAIIHNRSSVRAQRKITKEQRSRIYLYSKASNNMNQLAHRANRDHLRGLLDAETYHSILIVLLQISDYLRNGIADAD
ncbi:plasmid mobilization protein [Spirochaeta dissipatitropha]